MRAMSPRERKLVAIGLLVAAIAFVQLALIAPLLDGFTARADERRALTLRYQLNARTIASAPRLRRRAEQQRAATADFVLAAPSPTAAAQLLRERIERTIGDVGGEFRSVEELDAPPGRIAAQAAARLTVAQLAATLVRLQNEPPYLTVGTLDIAADEALVSGGPTPLDVKIDASIPVAAPTPR